MVLLAKKTIARMRQRSNDFIGNADMNRHKTACVQVFQTASSDKVDKVYIL
jgi:hypothetical protein